MTRNKIFLRLFTFVFSIVAAIVLIGLMRLLLGPSLQEILLDADSQYWPFTIQNVMWVALCIGFGELVLRWFAASEEESQLRRNYLPVDGRHLDEKLLIQIRDGVANRRYGLDCFLPSLIIRVIDLFRSTGREDQATSVMNSSLELYMHEIELRYSMLRYITWLIPSLGFIGTVMGIMLALQYAGVPANAESEEFLYQVTQRLGVAFTTTLVALVMSAILVLLQSVVQSKEERALNSAGQYCLDHLILKLRPEPTSEAPTKPRSTDLSDLLQVPSS